MQRFRPSLLLSALLVGGTFGRPQSAHAQAAPAIPNNSFEQWASQTVQTALGPRTIAVPRSWSLGFFSSFKLAFSGVAGVARSSTVAHSGTSSVLITIGADSSGGDVTTSVPVAANPLAMVAWARNSAVVPDTIAAVAIVLFTRTQPGGQVDTVAVAAGPLATRSANVWERKVMPIVALRPITPDSALIWLVRGNGAPGENTWIDDVSFTNSFTTGLAAEQPAARQPLSISPNPAPAGTTFSLTVPARAAGRAVLTITDVAGRAAGRVRLHQLAAGDNCLPVPTAGLAAGTYAVTVLSADGTRTSRLVIE